MFNVAVIRLKDIIKYLVALIVILIIFFMAKRYFFDRSEIDLGNINVIGKISNNVSKYVKYAISIEMPEIKQIEKNQEIPKEELIDENIDNADEEFTTQLFGTMLKLELGVMNAEEKEEKENVTQEKKEETKKEEKEEPEKEEEIELAKTDVKTEVVTKNPLKDNYTQKYKGVKIKNETNFNLTDDILNPDQLEIDKKNVIIFHTHTCESYTSSEKYSYKPTGNYRTTDKNYSVVRVGDELERYLTKYGIKVTHDKTYHDYPSYSGSYTRSLSTVSNILKNTKSDIIIDLHRDAIGSYSTYAPTVKIDDDYCAQLMFVMGTNGGGLTHPNWSSNLKFAVKIQEMANKLYPGLFKPIIVRNSRYNQHVSKAACIIEVGSTGNTLDQCLNSMKYLAELLK